MPTSPSKEQSELVTFEILSNGKPLNDTIQILSVKVKLEANAVDESIFKGIVIEQHRIINEEFGSVLQVTSKNHNNEGGVIRQQIIDTSKTAELEVTYGIDIIENEININNADPETITGYITFQGSTKAKVNDPIHIQGLGSRYCYKVIILGVLHEIKQGDWQTTVNVGHTVNK